MYCVSRYGTRMLLAGNSANRKSLIANRQSIGGNVIILALVEWQGEKVTG